MPNKTHNELGTAILVGEDIIDALKKLSSTMGSTDEDLTKARAWNNSLISLRALLLSELRKKREAVYATSA